MAPWSTGCPVSRGRDTPGLGEQDSRVTGPSGGQSGWGCSPPPSPLPLAPTLGGPEGPNRHGTTRARPHDWERHPTEAVRQAFAPGKRSFASLRRRRRPPCSALTLGRRRGARARARLCRSSAGARGPSHSPSTGRGPGSRGWSECGVWFSHFDAIDAAPVQGQPRLASLSCGCGGGDKVREGVSDVKSLKMLQSCAHVYVENNHFVTDTATPGSAPAATEVFLFGRPPAQNGPPGQRRPSSHGSARLVTEGKVQVRASHTLRRGRVKPGP